ncbi:hypothetical protein IH980_03590 [Patescibacteria group bacterium]|nr:hypothetical protein [Patescibacteria group bacterium]
MKKAKYIFISLLVLSVFLLLALVVKGERGKPIYHQSRETRDKKVGGPFESTGSTSRYALTEAIVEDNTFFFSGERARFSAPDMTEYKGKFFSIFTPGVSFIGIPFYYMGKLFGIPQLTTFFSTIVFAILNFFLVIKLARKLGAKTHAAYLAGLIFLFATNALVYALTYTQHHASVTLMLLAFLNLFGERTFLKNIWLGMIFGMGILIDLPNALMMFPIVMYAVLKHLSVNKMAGRVKLSLKLSMVGLVIGLIPFVALFGWYNYQLTGSFTKIGQTIGRSDYFDPPEVREQHRLERENRDPYERKLPLNTRNQLYELYILLISNERGWVYYSPIVVIGMLGLLLGYKNQKNQQLIIVAVAVVLTSIVIYSLFGGLGGWAFGPRYLIPAAALLCSALGIAIQKFRQNILFIIVFLILSIYSLWVNIVGAMTTTQVPPKVEAINMLNPIPYTYEYNFQLLEENKIGSLVYNVYLSDTISAKTFVYGYFLAALAVLGMATTAVVLEKTKQETI